MGFQAVPHEHDRRLDQLVCAVDEGDVVALGQAAALALAPGVATQPVAQPGPRAPGRIAIGPATETRPEPRPFTFTTGVMPRREVRINEDERVAMG
ncbi:hypothetical protein HOK021_37910 [Streptomyces hygroscopicus]|nr:hypothetical protein HOK021_37910 [Streptomyces hygroscopicus]